jgi:hypothetical protein
MLSAMSSAPEVAVAVSSTGPVDGCRESDAADENHAARREAPPT